MSEALIFASTNPQYDNRLFIVHENCKLRIPAEHVVYTNCCFCFVLTFRTILVHNMFCRCCELLKKIYLYINWNGNSKYFLSHCVWLDWVVVAALWSSSLITNRSTFSPSSSRELNSWFSFLMLGLLAYKVTFRSYWFSLN